ncbi:MAG: periplasmic protein TonB [Bacteroidetes bacterium]|nr:MAG: periplasmic protein TonB [Bacteroidota bacterium]
MRFVSLFSFFLFFSVILRAQPENGYYAEKHPGGEKSCEGNYKKGKKEGTWNCWSANGVLIRKENYRQGELHGRQIECYGEKFITSSSYYTMGLRDSVWKRFDEKGRVISERTYRNDLPGGGWDYYDWTSGQQIRVKREFYRDGLRDGQFIEWTNTGVRKSESWYKKDLRDSLWLTFDNSGRVLTESRYRDDLPNGVWRTWQWSGQKKILVQSENYVDGKRDGLFEAWNPDSTKKVSAKFKAGKIQAAPEAWDYTGAPVAPDQFEYCAIVYSTDLRSYYMNDTVLARKHMPGCYGYDPTEQVFDYTDTRAEFPGGIDSMNAYIRRNLRYPDLCKEQAIQGTVYIKFIVEKNGMITDAKIVRGIRGCPQMEKESLRVVKGMPRFKPARQGGRIVRSYSTIPFRFKLS